MNIKAQIPNLFTMLNLFCGCVALVMLSDLQYKFAFYFVCLGIFFDFFDGFFARKFKVAGPLGVQLDSLADMVTCGVVPGYATYLYLNDIEVSEFLTSHCMFEGRNFINISFFGFLITIGACYRLAKFNIDIRQSDSFIGLPTPANTLFFMSLPLIPIGLHENNFNFLLAKSILIILILISAYIMNAEIPLFSLKIKDFSVAKYKLQIFFLLVCILLLVFLHILAVPLIIILYVLLSVLDNFFKSPNKN